MAQGLVGSYRSEVSGGTFDLSKAMSQQLWVGGQPAASGDNRSHSGHKEKESVRSSMQQSFSHQDPRARGPDENYVASSQGLVGSYRGEGGGISGQPSNTQSLSGHKEKESARSLVQQSPSLQDPRVRGTDEDYMVRSY